ncbi:MAG: rRNA pseudouridine synthase [Acidaminococcales bacterium]|jgi:23S rRNA pseudouridine2605 synthase|nr:rRNA pseudouridine synthase [Acidaminococcales bacterium]
MRERLQKFLAKAGIASRREAEKIISAGRVAVNGRPVTQLGSKVDPAADEIFLDGKRVKARAKRYYLFYKPRGVVTTLSDPEGRTSIGDYVKDLPERVFPVGRLDYNTEGALLLTNDGELSQLLTHPKHKVSKTYRVGALGIISEQILDRLRIGIELEDGMTAPAALSLVEYLPEKGMTVFDITIHEGRNRQVRRMCDAIGHCARALKRTKFAGLSLAGLKRGGVRELDESEVARLYELARGKNDL